MLFACLTGGPPFKGDVPTVIKGHLAVEPPSVAGLASLPAGIDDVVRKGMAKDPPDRYDSCAELISSARKALEADAERRPAVAQVQAAGGQGDSRQPPRPGPWNPESQPTRQQNPNSPPWGLESQPTEQQPHPPPPVPHQSGWQRQPAWGQQFPPQQPQQPQYGPPQGYHPSGYQGPPPGYPPPGYGAPQGFPLPQQAAKKRNLLWLWLLLGAVVVAGGVVAIVVLNSGGGTSPSPNSPDIPVGPGGGGTATSAHNPPPPTISIRPS